MNEPGQVKSGPNLVLGLAAVVAAGSIALAFWALSSGDRSRPTTLPVVESHGLTPDQATCLAVAMVTNRSAAEDLEVELGKYQALDPGAELGLRVEVAKLGGVLANHPDADDQLVRLIGHVTDEAFSVITASDSIAYRTAVTGWAAGHADVRRGCLELADFDVETLQIGQSGR